MPQPAGKLVQISDEILSIVHKDVLPYRLSEFEVQKIFSLIRELKPINEEFYYSFLGVVYSLTGKEDESIANHQKALERQPDDLIIRSNFGSSLLRLGKCKEAKEQFMIAYNFNKSDPMSLHNAIVATYYSDDLESLKPLLEAYKKLKSSPHEAEEWLAEDAHDSAMLPEYYEESRQGPTISLVEFKKELGL